MLPKKDSVVVYLGHHTNFGVAGLGFCLILVLVAIYFGQHAIFVERGARVCVVCHLSLLHIHK